LKTIMNNFFEEANLPQDLIDFIDNNGKFSGSGNFYRVVFAPRYYKKLKELLKEIGNYYKRKGFVKVYMTGDESCDEIYLIMHKKIDI